MPKILADISRTFSEYLILPGLTTRLNVQSPVSLRAPVKKFRKGESPLVELNIPVVSACMQAVSGPELAIELARQGGMACIFNSQTIQNEAAMISKVKSHKAGFVVSDSNLQPTDTIKKFIQLRKKTGHSTMPVTEDGTSTGKLQGIITEKDFWEFQTDPNSPISDHMTPMEKVIYGKVGISLTEANSILHQNKKECLPILNEKGNLAYLVFTKDYVDHQNNPNELLDTQKRLVVAASINTHDYKDRVPALLNAGADVLCFDSSDGYSEFQAEAAQWIRKTYGDKITIGGGNVVSGEAFRYLVEKGDVDFVKVGIGGGSICITREQKGIGRGQASALMDVVEERNKYYEETGIYVPVCSDGGLANDTQIIIALAMGADFVMMGRYFAMTFESPTKKVSIKNKLYKPYWGEGSNRAKNWMRYSEEETDAGMKFEEGVDAYVPIVGSVKEILPITLSKLSSTMRNVGVNNLRDFYSQARLTLVSSQSFIEGGTPNVETFDQTMTFEN